MRRLFTLLLTVIMVVTIGSVPVGAEGKFKLTGKYTETGGSTIIKWTAYEGAEYYRIQMKQSTDKKWVTLFDYESDVFEFRQMRPRDSSKYNYRVVAVIGKKGYATNKLTIKGQGLVEVDENFQKILKKIIPTISDVTKPKTDTAMSQETIETKTTQHSSNVVDTDLMAKEVFIIVNNERENAGLESLSWSEEISKLAIIRAEEISTLYEHTRPNGKKWYSVIEENDVEYFLGSENIAIKYDSAKKVMDAFMNSKAHKDAILNPNYSKMAVGCYEKDGNLHWVQIFSV